jgi:predicted GH43/DUF377 family glycosyl hydrolase
MPGLRELIVWDCENLLPNDLKMQNPSEWRVFNPAICSISEGYILAYRIIGCDGKRRMALCKLDAALRVVTNSVVEISRLIKFDTRLGYSEKTKNWFADPRIFILNNKHFLYWNDGNDNLNNQFIIEINTETLSLVGEPLNINIRGERKHVEKNWGLFFQDELKAVYSFFPLRILSVETQDEHAISFIDDKIFNFQVPEDLRELWGGAPPIEFNGNYYCFSHVVEQHEQLKQYRAGVLSFKIDFEQNKLISLNVGKIELPNPFQDKFRYEKLNPYLESAVYITGAVRWSEGWLLTYGINDERCAAYYLPDEDVAPILKNINL